MSPPRCEPRPLTVVERERILTDAARRYIRGEIMYEQMTAIRLTVDRPCTQLTRSTSQ